jgi:RHS repeat-associated protein
VRSFSYDGAGNVTADTRGSTAYNYRYNKRGRLDELSIGSTVTADYTYDGLERLAIRTTQNMTPAGTTHYLYDRAGRLIVEADNTGQTLREYVWLDDMPLAVVSDINTSSPNLYYVHADHLNTPVRMTDGSKAVVWDAFFLPFGTVESITGSASNNLRFPGQYFLIEDGLHYNWYRHYDPTIGRYLQPDPLGLVEGSANLYSYVRQNPVSWDDPRGEQAGPIIAIAIAVGAWTVLELRWLWYHAQPHELPPPPMPPTPPIPPKNVCTPGKYARGIPPDEMRTWNPPPPLSYAPEIPEPPEFHELPRPPMIMPGR